MTYTLNTPEIMEKEVDFDQELHAIYTAFQQRDYTMDETLDQRLKKLMKHKKENMNVSSYMQVLYMQGVMYEERGNKNAGCYCAMRLLWMKECYHRRSKKRPLYLVFEPFAIPDEMDAFIKHKTAFLQEIYQAMNRKLLLVTTILFMFVFMILLFILQVNWLIGALEALLIGILNYLLQKKRFPDMFQKRQTQAVISYVEAEVVAFDQTYYT